MSKSSRPRLSDLRTVARLAGECRDLGDDAAVWWRHLIAGLARMTGAGFGLGAEIGGCVRGPRRDLGTADWGWENGFDRAGWLRMLAEFRQDPLYNPLMNAYIARLPRGAGACLTRANLIPDRDWYPSRYYRTLHRTLGVDATLVCFRPVPGVADEYSEVYLARAVGEPDFSARDRAVVREGLGAVGPLVGGPLARFTDPSPSELPPRVRQVLVCLLEGDSDKQAAARLGLSGHTVNGYTKAIYHHFRVGGRVELLALWVRRGTGHRRTGCQMML